MYYGLRDYYIEYYATLAILDLQAGFAGMFDGVKIHQGFGRVYCHGPQRSRRDRDAEAVGIFPCGCLFHYRFERFSYL